MVSALVPRCQGPLHPMAKESCSTSYFWKLSLGLLLCLNLGLTCSATERGSQLPPFALCPYWAAQQLPWRKGNSTYKQVRLQRWHGLTSFNHLRLSKTAKDRSKSLEQHIKLGCHDSNQVTLEHRESCHLDFAEPDFSKEISSHLSI